MNENDVTYAIVFAVDYDINKDMDRSLAEMRGLVSACEMEVAGILTQTLPHPDNAMYLGSGKVNELKEYVERTEASICICEGDLSPSQMRSLQDVLKVPVWDRTNLILEIFSRRAKTKEAKIQVEYAYLQFMLPRLSGMWQHLGRQGGGRFSNKGEGEKQIELDRRIIKHRMAELSHELEQISKTRKVQRDGRSRGEMPRVALVGYTNAGKSSLMNRLLGEEVTEKKVFEKDMLFATLDTSIRRIKCADNKEFLLSDTVGFIENLPHSLIKSFRSTLEEAAFADLILVVLDASDRYCMEQCKVTEATLLELGADKIPRIYVMNKCDNLDVHPVKTTVDGYDRIYISAKTGEGTDVLCASILEKIFDASIHIDTVLSYSQAELLNSMRKYAKVGLLEYMPDGVHIIADCSKRLAMEAGAIVPDDKEEY